MATLAQAVAVDGTIFIYGMLSGEPMEYPMTVFGKGIALTSYSLLQMKVPGRLEAMKTYIQDRLADRRFKPEIAKVFPFPQTADAYRYLESNQQVGKVVIAFE